MNISHIAFISVPVVDFDKAIEFYTQKLGLTLVKDTPMGQERWVEIEIPGGAVTQLVFSKKNPGEKHETELFGAVFSILNADELYTELKSKGIKVEAPITEPWGKYITVYDHEANKLLMVENIQPDYKPLFTANLSVYLNFPKGEGLKAMEIYSIVFNAQKISSMTLPMDKRVLAHGNLRIGDSNLMMSDVIDSDMSSPTGRPLELCVYRNDFEDTLTRAKDHGFKELTTPEKMPWGDLMVRLEDPYGFIWVMAKKIENVSLKEIEKRMNFLK